MNGTAIVDGILVKHNFEDSELIGILQDLQASVGWLPEKDLSAVSMRLKVPMSRIYGIATFYKAFSLKPRGRHLIQVCTGTACHVKGSASVVDRLQHKLRVELGGTTGDGAFSLVGVRCIGCCSLAPVISIGETIVRGTDWALVTKLLAEHRRM